MEHTNLQLIAGFAAAIDAQGIALVPSDLVAELVRVGRSVGTGPAALTVVADPTEPAIVRERAFDRIAGDIVRARSLEAIVVPDDARDLMLLPA